MDTINNEPISVDFGNAEKDGAIRLITSGAMADIERLGIALVDGKKIWLTDNEIEARGILFLRDGIWVAIVDEDGFKQVSKDAAYHINNLG